MSEWVETMLGEVLIEVDDRNSDGGVDLVLSVTEGRGIIPQADVFKKRIATDNTSKYKIVRPLDVAWNPYLLWTGAVGQWLGDSPGVTSPVYPVFRAKVGQEPRYWGLVLGSGFLTPYFNSTAVGSIQRRRRTTLAVFKSAVVQVPSLAEQRRIVDVMAAVDAQIEALAGELERGAILLDISISETLAALPRTRPLGEFTTTRSGPSYAAADVSPEPGLGARPAIGIPNTKPDGSIDMSTVGYVSGLGNTVGLVDSASLILIRTNGNRSRIGNVYLPPTSAHGYVVSAFQFLMKVVDPGDREFVYWVLRERSMQRAMSDAASGTTGLGNLAVKWLNSARVYWSDEPEQRRSAASALRVQQDNVDSLRDELIRQRTFRSAILTALLDQDVEIPESYNAVLAAELGVVS